MIPTNPPPTFRKPELWSDNFTDFVKQCLVKSPEQRATATQLLQVCLFLGEHQLWGRLAQDRLCCVALEMLVSFLAAPAHYRFYFLITHFKNLTLNFNFSVLL